MSQNELSDRAGLSRGHLSKLERNVREPRLETIVKLARAFDLTAAEFLKATLW